MFKIEAVDGGNQVTEIEWNEVEVEGEKAADWELINKDAQDKKDESSLYNEEETILYNHETR